MNVHIIIEQRLPHNQPLERTPARCAIEETFSGGGHRQAAPELERGEKVGNRTGGFE